MSSSDALQARQTSLRRRFSIGLVTSIISEHTVLFAIPLLIFQKTGSVAYSGVAYAVEWLPALVAYPVAGMLADRVGGRRMFVAANCARAFCLLVVFVICFNFPTITVGALMINSALLSLLIAPTRMAVEKTVPVLAADSTVARLQALVQNVELLGMAIGPALAAVLMQWVGKLGLLATAGTGFLAAAAFWRDMPSQAQGAGNASRVAEDLRLGWHLLITNRPVIMLACMNFTINLSFAIAISANAYLVTGVFHAPASAFGLMNAGAGLLGLVNLMLIPRVVNKASIYQVGAAGFSVMCLGLLSMGWATQAATYIVSFLVAMAGVAWFNVFNRTQRLKAIDPCHLGKVIGPFYLINCSAYPLAGIVTATAGAHFGVQRVLQVMAVVLTVPGAALLWATAQRFRLFFDHANAPAAVATPVRVHRGLSWWPFSHRKSGG